MNETSDEGLPQVVRHVPRGGEQTSSLPAESTTWNVWYVYLIVHFRGIQLAQGNPILA